MSKRLLLAAPLVAAALALLAGLHFYLARRLVLDPGIAPPWRGWLLGAIAAGGASLLLAPAAERLFGPPRSRVLSWPASLWMGLAFLLVGLLGASELLLWVAGAAASASPPTPGSVPTVAGARAAAVAILALAAAGLGLRSGLGPPRLQRLEIALERWPRALDGFRVVQISDLHLGPLLGRAFAERVASRVNALAPDLVAVTGDLVDGAVRHVRPEVEPLGRLRARCGVFFVTGNHDHYSGANAWSGVAAELGMRVLRNARVEIDAGADGFDLAGVDDRLGYLADGDGGEDLAMALAGRDPARPALLLAHDPSTFRRARRAGIDLQLSGHTHGGQIWPFRYAVRLATPYVAGLYREGRAWLYVSRGTGFWGPPMRLWAPAEITEITLRSAAPPN